MWQAIGKYVGGKVLTAILVVASAAGIIWFYNHPEQLKAIWQVIKYVMAWMGFVLVLPWAGFFITAWAVRKDANWAGAALLIGLLVLDIVVALFLAGGVTGHGTLTWIVLLLGFLTAGVYNFVVCNYQAEKIEATL